MPRKNKKRNKQKSLEKQIEALTISSTTAAQPPPQSPASPSPPPPAPTKLSTSSSSSSCTTPTPTCITSKDLTSQLRSAIHGRESFDALVTKHIFDKLKKSRISKDQIVDILLETGCPLDFALLMENAEVIRSMLERCQRDIPKKESCILVELAMRMPYLENLKPLVRYGPGAKCRRDMFFAQMFDMINRQGADLTSARRYVEKLVNADVIDEYTMQFLEKTFEVGNEEAIRMLLDMKIDDHVRRKFGEDMLVHLFGNVNVDALDVLRGRRFNVNAKCGDMAALHFATLSRLEKNVRILLNSGADPNVKDCHDMTPLFAFGDDKCITLLLHNGADIQAIADNGYTILHMIFAPNLQGILLAHIALIEARGTTIRKELRDKIVSNAAFVDFYDKACKQIEDMRSCRIHDDFNLWTALVRRSETIARFVNCQETVDELICECRHMQMHSYYLATLERNFVRAFSVYGLRCKAVEKLVKVFELVGLDEMIVERVVEYLEFEDLIVFA